MTTSINAVGFDFEKDQLDLISKKIERIKYAEDLIIDFLLKVKEDKKFIFDCTVSGNSYNGFNSCQLLFYF